jgi:hypothetical protein
MGAQASEGTSRQICDSTARTTSRPALPVETRVGGSRSLQQGPTRDVEDRSGKPDRADEENDRRNSEDRCDDREGGYRDRDGDDERVGPDGASGSRMPTGTPK